MESSVSKITAFGSEWFKAGATRAYFNNLEELYGLEFLANDAGRIIKTTLDGEPIELTKALALRAKLAFGQVWFDFETVTFHYKNLDPVIANHIIGEISKQITED